MSHRRRQRDEAHHHQQRGRSGARKALTLTGNHGLSRTNPLERHLRDVLCGRVHNPQDDTIKIAAGRLALGLQ